MLNFCVKFLSMLLIVKMSVSLLSSNVFIVLAFVVISAPGVVVSSVVLAVVDVVVVSSLSLLRTSMTDSVLVETFWLRPERVWLGGSSCR